MYYFWLFSIIILLICIFLLTLPLVRKKNRNTPNYILMLSLIVIFPVLVVLLYLHWGNYPKISQWYAMKDRTIEVRSAIKQFGSRQAIIRELKRKLEELPDSKKSAQGWYILGKLYLSNQQIQPGMAAFKKAISLDPENPEISLAFVTIKYYIEKDLDYSSKEILKKITQIQPYQIDALNLLASVAYQNKNYDEAIYYWEKLIQLIPANTEETKNLLTVIANAQRLRIQKNVDSKQHISITITINISNDLKSKIKSSDTLFIYALAINGPKIPLAVKKLPIQQFPISVSLNDNDAMIASHKLSNANHVKVEARISKTGNAMTKTGDLVGSEIIDIHRTSKVNLLINSQI